MMEANAGSAVLCGWLDRFARALAAPDRADWADLFEAEASWRV